MLHAWEAPLGRATMDLDLLGRLDNSLENLQGVVSEVCTAEVEPDGMVFDPATVKTGRIKEDAECEGVRVRFVGMLGRSGVAMRVEVGSGDVVTPGAQDITYPARLGWPHVPGDRQPAAAAFVRSAFGGRLGGDARRILLQS
jgi:hypothetical protein